MSAEKLYTPQVLALATGLANWPWDDGLPLKGAARSRSCGSSLEIGLGLDAKGRIERVALRTQACAIGQAAAAIFAAGAPGRDAAAIHESAAAISAWLAGQGAMPGWPGLGALSAAQGVPGRHGAIMLAWIAAQGLLPTSDAPR